MIKCFEAMNDDFEQKTRLDLKMRHALAVSCAYFPRRFVNPCEGTLSEFADSRYMIIISHTSL